MTDDFVPYPAKIIVDANTLISATLTRGITREMLLTTEDTLYSPAFVRDEIEKHRATLRDKSGLADSDLDTHFDTLFATIEILPKNRTIQHHKRAEQAMEGIDMKDAIYVAAALEVDGAIWSNDPHLHEQTLRPALTTEAMVARVRQAQRKNEGEQDGED